MLVVDKMPAIPLKGILVFTFKNKEPIIWSGTCFSFFFPKIFSCLMCKNKNIKIDFSKMYTACKDTYKQGIFFTL